MKTGNRHEATGNSKKAKVIGFALCALLFALCASAEAQQPGKVPRIGYLHGGLKLDGTDESFHQGLREFGYIEGKNVVLEYRYAKGKLDRFPELAADLARSKVDIIVAVSETGARAAKNATQAIPIVMVGVATDPAEVGLVETLARPGGNITGLTLIAVEIAGKALNLRLQSFEVGGPEDFDSTMENATKVRAGALLLLRNYFILTHQTQIANLATKHRLPSVFDNSEFVAGGGVMSYGANIADSYRRAAVFVDKILKGTKPADIPVEQPTKFEFVVNLKAAKQIGLTIPPNVLARADKVIK